MELKITDFFNKTNPFYYSASVAELGEDVGKITWENALDCGFSLINTEEEKEAARDHFRAYGAWAEEEIAAWTGAALNALVIQEISAEMRDLDELAAGDWSKWQELCTDGAASGRLYGGELSTDGEVYFYLGE